jgi:UTP:GlnB (protein PII) uridylyltransferase
MVHIVFPFIESVGTIVPQRETLSIASLSHDISAGRIGDVQPTAPAGFTRIVRTQPTAMVNELRLPEPGRTFTAW